MPNVKKPRTNRGTTNISNALREGLRAATEDPTKAVPEGNVIRVHRAISWLTRAEVADADDDARFLFLWIAFNALYAQEWNDGQHERGLLAAFIEKLVAKDYAAKLQKLLFERFSCPIRVLLANPYVFAPFWRALQTHDASEQWKLQHQQSQSFALAAIARGDTEQTLGVVFDRLYTLRNQLVHGGATWGSKVNRAQVRDGCAVLGEMLPTMIAIVTHHLGDDWGELIYPVVGAPHR